MKRRAPSLWAGMLVVAVVGLLSAACGGGTPTPTPLPTATATPRSTPLPEVPTAVPLASEGRPLTVLMVPQGARREAVPAADSLEALIAELTGLRVEIQLADSYGQIVAQLCSATPVAGWLDGFALVAAEAAGCADPALQVVRSRRAGFQVEMLLSAEFAGDEVSADDLARLAGRRVCRATDEDAAWLAAEMILRAAGINPVSDLEAIVDVENYDTVVTSLYNGDCQGGVVPSGYLRSGAGEAVRALEGLADRVVSVSESPLIPYNVLVYPPTVPLHIRIPLSDVFLQIAADASRADALAGILQQDSLERVTAESFAVFRRFTQASGLDFVALGE